MNCSIRDLLTVFATIGSLLVGACVCAETHRISNPATMPKNRGSVEASPGVHAHDVEHVLAGVTHQVGADGSGKTSGSGSEREPLAFF